MSRSQSRRSIWFAAARPPSASTIQQTISDPLARKLVEWTILRSDENDAGFNRLAAFIADNPSWPNATMLRRRAESALWDERRSADTLRAFFASSKPMTAKGKFALARALLAAGRHPGRRAARAPGLARGHLLGGGRARRDGHASATC